MQTLCKKRLPLLDEVDEAPLPGRREGARRPGPGGPAPAFLRGRRASAARRWKRRGLPPLPAPPFVPLSSRAVFFSPILTRKEAGEHAASRPGFSFIARRGRGRACLPCLLPPVCFSLRSEEDGAKPNTPDRKAGEPCPVRGGLVAPGGGAAGWSGWERLILRVPEHLRAMSVMPKRATWSPRAPALLVRSHRCGLGCWHA